MKRLSWLLRSLSLSIIFASPCSFFFILVFQTKPSYASIQCEQVGVRSVPGRSDIRRRFSTTGSNLSDCDNKINNLHIDWCNSFPIERGSQCYLVPSTFRSSGSSQGGSSAGKLKDSCATLYSNGDLTGRSYSFHVNHKPRYLGRDFNDRASSAVVKKGYRLRLFEHRDFRGKELRLDDQPQFGRADFREGGNNTMEFRNFPGFMWNKASSGICERVR